MPDETISNPTLSSMLQGAVNKIREDNHWTAESTLHTLCCFIATEQKHEDDDIANRLAEFLTAVAKADIKTTKHTAARDLRDNPPTFEFDEVLTYERLAAIFYYIGMEFDSTERIAERFNLASGHITNGMRIKRHGESLWLVTQEGKYDLCYIIPWPRESPLARTKHLG